MRRSPTSQRRPTRYEGEAVHSDKTEVFDETMTEARKILSTTEMLDWTMTVLKMTNMTEMLEWTMTVLKMTNNTEVIDEATMKA